VGGAIQEIKKQEEKLIKMYGHVPSAKPKLKVGDTDRQAEGHADTQTDRKGGREGEKGCVYVCVLHEGSCNCPCVVVVVVAKGELSVLVCACACVRVYLCGG
jgi:hypothetical protein